MIIVMLSWVITYWTKWTLCLATSLYGSVNGLLPKPNWWSFTHIPFHDICSRCNRVFGISPMLQCSIFWTELTPDNFLETETCIITWKKSVNNCARTRSLDLLSTNKYISLNEIGSWGNTTNSKATWPSWARGLYKRTITAPWCNKVRRVQLMYHTPGSKNNTV